MDRLQNPRELRGLTILSQLGAVIQVGKNEWHVKSQSSDEFYRITRMFIKGRDSNHFYDWACTCLDYMNRHVICKHILAVQFSLKLQIDIVQDATPEQLEKSKSIAICPKCRSSLVIRSGNRKTGLGTVQRYECKACDYRFVIDKGFSKMKHDPNVITLTLDLYFKGLSNRKIRDHIMQFHDLTVAHTTLLRWIKKYLTVLARYVEKNKINTGNIWHADETTVFIKKCDMKHYYQWVWNVMDAKTRYLLACQVTEERYVKDARKPLKVAKAIAAKRPDAIVTDGLQAYNSAIKAEFYDINAQIQNPHVRLKSFEIHPNNNILERLNGTFRERTKVLRSLDSDIGAQEFVTGMQVYYNYIRPHQGLGGFTPAQMANIPIDLMGNRWQKMIGLAVKG